MFCIVRNPLEVIPSFAYLVHMRSHSLVPKEKINEQFPEWWANWSKQVSEYMQYNHDYIMNTLSKKIPTYIIRYEDLILNPEPVLNELFCFLLDVPTIEGTVVEQRIKLVSSGDNTTKSVYALKDKTKNLNKNRSMYDDNLMKELSTILKEYNIYYGYSNIGQPEEDCDGSETEFFQYSESEVSGDAHLYGFSAFNADSIARIGQTVEPMQNHKFTNDIGGMSKLKKLDKQLTVKDRVVTSIN